MFTHFFNNISSCLHTRVMSTRLLVTLAISPRIKRSTLVFPLRYCSTADGLRLKDASQMARISVGFLISHKSLEVTKLVGVPKSPFAMASKTDRPADRLIRFDCNRSAISPISSLEGRLKKKNRITIWLQLAEIYIYILINKNLLLKCFA